MINISSLLQAVDTHTVGEPTRIILKGIPKLETNTMWDKKQELEEKFDHLRAVLMNEPRGHSNMFGAFITEPCNKNCDLGVVFANTKGYLNMCGHGTIAVVTAGISLGMIEKKEKVLLDTPAGIISCHVTFENEKVKRVSFHNAPAFVYRRNLTVKIEENLELTLDISYGGNFFAILDATQLSLSISLNNAEKFIDLGMKIKDAVNKQITISHPDYPHINTVDLVEFSEQVEDNYYRNVVVFGNGQIDRSPCGTGTSAKLALLNFPVGEQMKHESIIGTSFTASVVKQTKVGHFNAIIPQVSGSAWITGFHQFVIDQDDPFKHGFSV